ncbi:4Fe-4S binding protein [Mycolicibacterium vaccae]|nr:4Fe-4S binding protein [Mycolicibacterium vaccae]
MTYVIGSACVDIVDKSCVQECPADCIYEGDRAMYINPNECVDCGACRIACRVDAIYYETDLPDEEMAFLEDNAAFFALTLPGRDEPLGDPGGASKLGRVGADTPAGRRAAAVDQAAPLTVTAETAFPSACTGFFARGMRFRRPC